MLNAYCNDIVVSLFVSKAVTSFKILKQEISEEEAYLRIKATLANKNILEFSEYLTLRKTKVHLETYSFHWQTDKGVLIKRWDNVEHHKEISTFPHHIHLDDDRVIESSGATLEKVLLEIEAAIKIEGD